MDDDRFQTPQFCQMAVANWVFLGVLPIVVSIYVIQMVRELHNACLTVSDLQKLGLSNLPLSTVSTKSCQLMTLVPHCAILYPPALYFIP